MAVPKGKNEQPRPVLRFNDVADRMLENDPDCDLPLLQRAYVFSAKVHEGQERLSGEPYLVHPLVGLIPRMARVHPASRPSHHLQTHDLDGRARGSG